MRCVVQTMVLRSTAEVARGWLRQFNAKVIATGSMKAEVRQDRANDNDQPDDVDDAVHGVPPIECLSVRSVDSRTDRLISMQ
jgi:hypothetical protein